MVRMQRSCGGVQCCSLIGSTMRKQRHQQRLPTIGTRGNTKNNTSFLFDAQRTLIPCPDLDFGKINMHRCIAHRRRH